MLNGIPFGGSGRIVRDGDDKAKSIRYLGLDFSLPGPGSATVAATGIRQNQQLGRAAIATGAFAFPPGGDGTGVEGGRVVGDADTDGTTVVWWVVNSVGDAHPAGIGKEVMIVHRDRPAVPFSATVFEVADQFALFGVI